MSVISTIHYCRQCGRKMEEGFAFCPECGTPVAAPMPHVTRQPFAQPEEQQAPPPFMQLGQQTEGGFPPAKPRKPIKLSKGAIVAAASGLVVIGLVVGAFFFGKYWTDEERLISRFEKIATAGDGEKLNKLLADANADAPFDRKTADAVADYLKDNDDAVEALVAAFREQATELKAGDVETFSGDDDAPFLYLGKKDKKKWLLYPEYELKIKRYMIPVSSNFEGASIYVDGDKSAPVQADGSAVEVGPLFPGEHEVKVVYEGEYATLENKQDVSLFPMHGYDDELYLDLQGDYVNVYADNTAAQIFINGKDTGLTADGNEAIGPIALDGSNAVYVQAEYPWGTVRTEERPLTEEYVEFRVDPMTDGLKDEIMTAMNECLASWTEALTKLDAGLAKSMGGTLLQRLNDNISTMQGNGNSYLGSYDSITYDLDSFRLYPGGDGRYSASVNVREVISEAILVPESDYDLTPETYDTQYLLEYRDGEWIATEAYSTYDFSTANTKSY